ncbi:MAG TPA: hypothetical protein VKD66_15055, partial [Streptosporangiaceae bacterium]|nr:hypothetical protein [Streptosporangiaceae bacterium]
MRAGERLAGLLRAHVSGRNRDVAHYHWFTRAGKKGTKVGLFPVGSYLPDERGLSRFAAIDFDGGGDHAAPLADPAAAALAVLKRAAALGIPLHLEKSKSCAGWHLWLFCDAPVSAEKLRELLQLLCPTDAQL